MTPDVSADDFDAVFYPGGHGPMWDIPDNRASIALIEAFVKADKPVSAVCHAPASLEDRLKERGGLYSKGADWGPYVQVEGKRVTGQNPASSRPAPLGAFTGDALLIDGDGFTLLNVRGKEEFESGHLRTAVHEVIYDHKVKPDLFIWQLMTVL